MLITATVCISAVCLSMFVYAASTGPPFSRSRQSSRVQPQGTILYTVGPSFPQCVLMRFFTTQFIWVNTKIQLFPPTRQLVCRLYSDPLRFFRQPFFGCNELSRLI